MQMSPPLDPSLGKKTPIKGHGALGALTRPSKFVSGNSSSSRPALVDEFRKILDLIKQHAIGHRSLVTTRQPNIAGRMLGSVAYIIHVEKECKKCDSADIQYQSMVVPGNASTQGSELLATTWYYTTVCKCLNHSCGNKWEVIILYTLSHTG